MTKTKSAYIAVLASLLASMTAYANPITFTQHFSGGFDLSLNGAPVSASGPITIVGIVDDGAADIDPGLNGEFTLTSVRFTGMGFVNELVATPLGLLVWDTDKFAFQLLGQFNEGITGWNGSTSAGDFIVDLGDLTTLFGLPYTTTGTSTFWHDGLNGNEWTLALMSGDTIGGAIGAGGPDGTFSINATVAVPEPGTLALLGIGLAGLGLSRRRKK